MIRHPFPVSLLLALLLHGLLLAMAGNPGLVPDAADSGLSLTLRPGAAPAVSRSAPVRDSKPGEAPAPPAESADPATEAVSPQRDGGPAGTEVARTDVATTGGDESTTDNDASDLSGRPASGSRSTYLSRVRAILARHHDYPPEAERRRIEGVVKASFVIGPKGGVADFNIAESSGSHLLDRATEHMFARLSFPPLPMNLGEQLALSVPIAYRLN